MWSAEDYFKLLLTKILGSAIPHKVLRRYKKLKIGQVHRVLYKGIRCWFESKCSGSS